MARGRPRGLVPPPFNRAVYPPADPGAGHASGRLVLAGRWRSGHPGPLVWDAVPGVTRGEGGGPRSLGVPAACNAAGNRPWQRVGLDRGWQGAALARRQLAAATAAHLVFHSSLNHRPAHPRPPEALVKYMEGVLQREPIGPGPCVQPPVCSSKATWAGDLAL